MGLLFDSEQILYILFLLGFIVLTIEKMLFVIKTFSEIRISDLSCTDP